MAKPDKVEAVATLRETLGRARGVILTGFSGLDVAQMEELRRGLKREGAQFLVVKNTLARLASQDTPLGELFRPLSGPTALALTFSDSMAPFKFLTEFARNQPKLQIRGGAVGSRILRVEEIRELARLPSREILLAQLLGGLKFPMANLAGVLSALLRNLLGVLTAIKNKKEKEV